MIVQMWFAIARTHKGERLPSGHVVAQHEVGQHAGRAPAHPHLAVHQNLPATVQRQVYELCHVVEVDCDVGLWDIK